VGTGQGNDLLVVETHSVEDDSKMVLSLFVSATLSLKLLNGPGRRHCSSVLLWRCIWKGERPRVTHGNRPSVKVSWCSNPSVRPSLQGILGPPLSCTAQIPPFYQQVSIRKAQKYPYQESTSLRKKSMEIGLLSAPCDHERFSSHVSTALLDSVVILTRPLLAPLINQHLHVKKEKNPTNSP